MNEPNISRSTACKPGNHIFLTLDPRGELVLGQRCDCGQMKMQEQTEHPKPLRLPRKKEAS